MYGFQIIDIVLIAILAYFFFWGFSRGLIKAVGSFAGLIVAVVIAGRYFEQFSNQYAPYVGLEGSPNVAKVITFIVLLVVVNRLAMLVVNVVAKAYNTMAVIPGMKLGNRLLGAALGLIEGAIMIGLIIFVISRFPFGSFIQPFLDQSRVAPIVLSVSSLLQPLLPEAIRQIQGLI